MYGGGCRETTILRMILSAGANILVKEFLGLLGILTVSSFYRLYSGRTILRMQSLYGPRIMEMPGFESMVDFLMELVFTNTTISEVPMYLDSAARKGKSKMKRLKTVMGYFKLWAQEPRWMRGLTVRCARLPIRFLQSSSTLDPL
jgi:hypothetical protein